MVCKSLLLEFLLIFSGYIRRKLNARCILELDIVQTFPGDTVPTQDVVLLPCSDKTLTRNIK